MKRKQELDVDFIGGERKLTEEDKAAFSAFFSTYKKMKAHKGAAPKRTTSTPRKKVVA
jgi:hypothetical protein